MMSLAPGGRPLMLGLPDAPSWSVRIEVLLKRRYLKAGSPVLTLRALPQVEVGTVGPVLVATYTRMVA